MKYEDNLRWWVDWLGQLTENDPAITFQPEMLDGQSKSLKTHIIV